MTKSPPAAAAAPATVIEPAAPPSPPGEGGGAAAALGRFRPGARFWLLLPALVLFALLLLYPLVTVIADSFSGHRGTFANFERIVGNRAYVQILINTLVISLQVTVACLVVGFPLATLIARTTPRVSRILLTLVLVTLWSSVLVKTYAWTVVLGGNGVVSKLLMVLGLRDQPLSILPGRIPLVIALTHVMLPYMVVALSQRLRSIDPVLGAAAQSLGADGRRRFLHVTLPLSMPGVAAGSTLVFLLTTGFFVVPAMVGGAHDTMMSQAIEVQVSRVLDRGFGSALAVVLMVVTLGLYAVWKALVERRGWLGAAR